jgi:hypothetical protein
MGKEAFSFPPLFLFLEIEEIGKVMGKKISSFFSALFSF